MYSNFKEQAVEYVKQAVHEENVGNYAKAFSLYMNALEYFKVHLKYEKDPEVREAITKKFSEYLRRAEVLRAVLDEGRPSGGGAVVTAHPKMNVKDGDDLSRVKALSFKEQAIEYVKQAVQEDNAGNYTKAFPLYMNALEYFTAYLKYENNPNIREAVNQKLSEYLRRAEELKVFLGDGIGGAGLAVKTKPKDGEGSSCKTKDSKK